jgi:hypothetical protein
VPSQVSGADKQFVPQNFDYFIDLFLWQGTPRPPVDGDIVREMRQMWAISAVSVRICESSSQKCALVTSRSISMYLPNNVINSFVVSMMI